MTTESIVFYEDRNFQGRSYVCKGDTSDLHSFFSRCNSAKVTGHLKLKLFERPNFDGKTWEVTESTPSIQERFLCREIHSCKVQEGPCVFFEHANYRGHQYLLEKGEYRRHTEWGAMHATVGSIHQITTDC
ncbi:beta-crystallin S-like [Sinocyclocheilus grahami]|uniref:beta-crystallin S-like n=1 Tax=Sinocyclocheilus grahami TaxID=75366 RepID=UPI0007AD4609|nr:PREDICTED: beta-crystallin S-like [Sinocyclocheilus grahami]